MRLSYGIKKSVECFLKTAGKDFPIIIAIANAEIVALVGDFASAFIYVWLMVEK